MSAFRHLATGLAAGILSLLWITAAPAADPAPTVSLNIKPQPLDAALNSFAQQSGLQIVYLSGVGKGLTSPRLTGDYTPSAALDLLLANTALAYRFLNERTVEVSIRKEKPAEKSSAAAPPGAVIQLASVPPEAVGTASGASSDAGADAGENAAPEILVKGSRVLNTDIRRTENDAQPYVVFDRETITRSGAVNVEDFLRNRLTSASTFVSNAQYADQSGTYSRISLRGLGEAETLILIDGRRAVGRAGPGIAEQPDINAIPMASIERIEVLPSTASAIYGGGATGGVINVVLRRDFSGVEARVMYGNTFDSDVARRQMDLASGFSLEDGRSSIQLSAHHSDGNALLEQDRGLKRRGRLHILANNPGALTAGVFPPLGATANIRSADGLPLVLDNGSALGFATTTAPSGYAGILSDTGARLAENAGRFNLDLPDSAQVGGRRSPLLPAPLVQSANATLKREFAPWLDAYMEFGISRHDSSSVTDASTGSVILAGNAAGNPFASTIIVTAPTGLELATETRLSGRRVVAGAIARLPRDWNLNLDHTWTWNRHSSSRANSVDEALYNADVRNGIVDIFQDPALGPIDYSPYLMEPVVVSPVVSTLRATAIRASGPALSAPGGFVTATVMLERQDNRLRDFRNVQPLSGGGFLDILAPARSQTIDSAYLEFVVPLLPARKLELQVAGRLDRYSIETTNLLTLSNGVPIEPLSRATKRFKADNPTIALRYQPVPDMMLRGSYATGYLPPSLGLLAPSLTPPRTYSGGFAPLFGWTDPLRGNEFLGNIQANAASRDLRPEQSESVSAGIVLTPRAVPGLRVSVDWNRIERTDNIVYLFLFGDNLLREALFRDVPGGVVRGPVPVGDPYGVGPIVTVNEMYVNLARADIETYDLSVSHVWQLAHYGALTATARATYAPRYALQVSAGSPVADMAGTGEKLKWRSNGELLWENGNWGLSWASRYYHDYYLNSAHTLVANQGGARISGQHYHDIQASYRFSASSVLLQGLFAGVEISAGVNNVFNTNPPVDVGSSTAMFYSPLGDPRRANYYLSIRKAL